MFGITCDPSHWLCVLRTWFHPIRSVDLPMEFYNLIPNNWIKRERWLSSHLSQTKSLKISNFQVIVIIWSRLAYRRWRDKFYSSLEVQIFFFQWCKHENNIMQIKLSWILLLWTVFLMFLDRSCQALYVC